MSWKNYLPASSIHSLNYVEVETSKDARSLVFSSIVYRKLVMS